MPKLRTIKKLLKIEENGWGIYYPHEEEFWIIGCYKHYNKMLLKSTTEIQKNYIERWWKGCLESYNKNRLKLLKDGNQ